METWINYGWVALFTAALLILAWRLYHLSRPAATRTPDEYPHLANPPNTPDHKRAERWYTLILRERAVADLARQGMTNDEIARELSISRRTVEKHLEHIFQKLEIRSRVELHYVQPHLGYAERATQDRDT